MRCLWCMVFSVALLLMLSGCQSDTAANSSAAYTPVAVSGQQRFDDSTLSSTLLGYVADRECDVASGKFSSAVIDGKDDSKEIIESNFFRISAAGHNSSSGKLTSKQCESVDLALLRDFLEIYYADADQIASWKTFEKTLNLKAQGDFSVKVISRGSLPKYNLITADGEFDIVNIPGSWRRNDIKTNIRKLQKRSYIGTDRLSSAYARLIRSAELKFRYNVLKGYAGRVNYSTDIGKGIALELMNAIEVEGIEFRFSEKDESVYSKISLVLTPKKMSLQTSAFIGLLKNEYFVLNEKSKIDCI